MKQFQTENEFLAAIAHEWPSTGTYLAQALTAGISHGEAAARGEADRGEAGLNLKLKGWVLRTEDIPVIEAIGIAGAAATAIAGPGGMAAAAVITAITGFAATAWKAWRKGAPLSKLEIAVLALLGVQGPTTDADLVATAVAQIPNATAEDIAQSLQSLTEVQLRDGQIVELVRRDASGRWRAASV